MAWRTAMGATRISVHATKCGSQRPKSRRKRAGFQPSGVATAIPTAQGANGARATVRRMFRRTMPDSVSGESIRSEEHTSELQSLMRISYAVFCLKKKNINGIKVSKNIYKTYTKVEQKMSIG